MTTSDDRRFYIHKKYGVDVERRKISSQGRLLLDDMTVDVGDFKKLGRLKAEYIRRGYSKTRLRIVYL